MIDIVQTVTDHLTSKIKQWPVRSNRASEIGHPCQRYLVYQRTLWEKKALHDVGLQFIFNEGNLHEDAVLRLLTDAGIQFVEQQRSYEWKEYQITGHIDCKVVDNGLVIPTEIKSLNQWNFESISAEDGIQDMLAHRSIYMRKYPAQLMLYILMDNKELGQFILKEKSTGQLKQIILDLNKEIEFLLDGKEDKCSGFEYAELLLQRAEAVNQHVADGTLPDRISWLIGACEHCSYAHICTPTPDREATLRDDPVLEKLLIRRAELQPSHSEYNKVDKQVKAAIAEIPEMVVGDWHIKGGWVDRKAYSVKAGRYWKTQIKHL